MREWGNFLFFASFFLLYFSGSMYIAWRICAGFKLIAPHKYYIFAAFGLMAAVSTMAYIFSKYNIDPFAVYLSSAGGIWMGIVGISVTVLALNDIVNFANLLLKIKDFRYYSTLAAVILIVLLCAWSLINVAFILKVKEIKIKVPELKTDKLSITLLADIHIDKQTSYGSIKKIVGIANGLDSDIIVLAGDLLDIDITKTYELYGLDKLRAKYGIFAVTGNHEYFAGVDSYIKLCEMLGIILLRNQNTDVKDDGREIIAIAGVNDPEGIKFKADTVDIEAAFSGIEKDAPVIFLSHRPELFDLVKDKDMPLVQLSGHTHAGQIPPVEFIRRFMKYNFGMYENGKSKMYVTSGNRWWRVPMRTFNTGEIVKIMLERG